MLSSLQEIILHLDNIRDIFTLHLVSKDINERINSKDVQTFYHRKKHGCLPPEFIYTPKEYPWRLEFSFLDQRFFFFKRSNTESRYFYPFGAYVDALEKKDKWASLFLCNYFKIGKKARGEKHRLYHRDGTHLSREQIEFVMDTGKPTMSKRFIELLADHGDIEYFESILSKQASEKKEGFIKIDKARHIFSQRTISVGHDRLLEAYERYKPDVCIFILKYHPDQEKIPGINKDILSLARAKDISHQKFYTIGKEILLRDSMLVRSVNKSDDFIRWLYKNHPEDIAAFYGDYGNNYYLDKHHNRRHINLNYILDSTWVYMALSSEDSWEKIITYISTSKETIVLFMESAIRYTYYSRFLEILEWDPHRVISLMRAYNKRDPLITGFYELLLT